VHVFINYRVADTGGYAWAVYFRLAQRFGAGHVFFDKVTLQPGARWFDEIKAHASGSGVFLALIGPDWAQRIIECMRSGREDFVVREISRALRTQTGVEVVPVLVNTDQPSSRMLPPAVLPLFERQWTRLTHETLAADVDRLIARLEEIAA
jgi:hypothetical protein